MSFDIGVFDDDGDLRYVFSSTEMAFEKVNELEWGNIYKIKVKKLGKELI